MKMSELELKSIGLNNQNQNPTINTTTTNNKKNWRNSIRVGVENVANKFNSSSNLTMKEGRFQSKFGPDINTHGVSLNFLRIFLKLVKIKQKENLLQTNCMTSDVQKLIIMPMTVEEKNSVCEYLLNNHKIIPFPNLNISSKDITTKANIYIIHTWTNTFESMIYAIEEFCKFSNRNMKIDIEYYFWIDIFCFNQWSFVNDYNDKEEIIFIPRSLDWYTKTLHNFIKYIGHSLLICLPWNKTTAFKRTWCLFELLITQITNCKFSIQLSKKRHEEFMKLLIENYEFGKEVLLQNIDINYSNSSYSNEKKMLLSAMEYYCIQNDLCNGNILIRKLINNWIKEITELLIHKEIEIIENEIKVTNLEYLNFIDIVLYAFGCKKNKDNIVANRKRTEKKYSLMSSLASIYAENDEIDKACNYYEILFKGRKEILGNTHPSTLHTQGNLALMYKKKFKFEESLELYKICLDIKNDILGPNHPSTFNTMYNYSILLKELNRYDDALPLLYISLDNQEDILGKEHQDTIRTCEYIGTILIEQGNMIEAKKYLLRSMDSNIKLYGKYNKDTLHSMEIIAEILFVENNYHDSILLYEDILKRYEEIEKNEELNIEITFITRKRLATIYKIITRYNDAIFIFENILQFELNKFSKLHDNTIETYTLLAESYKLYTDLNNHLNQSELNYRILLTCHLELYGKDDLKTVNIKYQLASLLSEMEQYDESKSMHEEVLEQRRILIGDQHIDTLVSMFCLANDELIFKNYERCYYLFQESLSGFDKLLGEDHIHSLATCESYLSLAKLLKDNKTSETLVQRLISTYMAIHGPNHTITMSAVRTLKDLLY